MSTKILSSRCLALLSPSLTCIVIASVVLAAGWIRKTTRNDWTWYEDYAFAWATYRVACEPNRRCQVGMGIFAFGAPRGEKISYSGELDILVVGFGSLHIRPADGQGPVKAAIAPKVSGLISITWDF